MKAKKYTYISLGLIFTALGIIGAFLPILPTTPFLILAAHCFSKSSKKLHDWLFNLPKIGLALRDWEEKREIGLKSKIMAISLIIISGSIIWLFTEKILVLKIVITTILLAVIIYIWTRKTKNESTNSQ